MRLSCHLQPNWLFWWLFAVEWGDFGVVLGFLAQILCGLEGDLSNFVLGQHEAMIVYGHTERTGPPGRRVLFMPDLTPWGRGGLTKAGHGVDGHCDVLQVREKDEIRTRDELRREPS